MTGSGVTRRLSSLNGGLRYADPPYERETCQARFGFAALLALCVVGYIWTLQYATGGTSMAYFTRKMDRIERGGKVAADIFCVLFLGSLASACAGALIGVTATILVTLGLLVIDYFVPDADDPPGAVVR